MTLHPSPLGATFSRRAALGLAAGTATAALAGCHSATDTGNDIQSKIESPPPEVNLSGFPLVTKPTTLDFMTGTPAATANDWNTVASWQQYQKQTDVTVNWGPIPVDSIAEKRNLALSSGDYPGAVYGGRFTALDAGKYGEQGVFVTWNDLIDKYMPNLKALMQKYPQQLAKGMTYPDGSIYGCPNLQDPDFTALKIKYKLWIRTDWLDKLGLKTPTTVDDLTAYLRAVKAAMPNGKSTVPYGEIYGGSGIVSSLAGAFGFGNLGATQTFLDLDPDGKLRFFPICDGYHDLLVYVHQLYAERLIAQDVFSVDTTKFASDASKGNYGGLITMGPETAYGEVGKNYQVVPALTGPNGAKSWNYVYARLTNPANFVLTDHTEHPVVTARWMDYFYSDEGTKLFFMGVEGTSYQETANGVEYLPKIASPGNGQTLNQALKPYVTYMGGGYPGIVKAAYFHGDENSAQAVAGAKILEPDCIDDAMPSLLFTTDEQSKLNDLATDIEKYASESRDRFISGDLKIDDGWDGYVAQLQKMGLDDYMAIQDAAYQRYAGQ